MSRSAQGEREVAEKIAADRRLADADAATEPVLGQQPS
ncbi:hypothetical protein N234_25820 [Ralstonia pickettii DTP0602]|nr:hypothetical protein N234_25820 [Ralstonia pickettii DTP0602]